MPDPAHRLALLDDDQVGVLRTLLEVVLPYPPIPGGPQLDDTVAYVLRRLEREDRHLLEPLEELLPRLAGEEAAWVAEVAASPEQDDHQVFQALRGWAWDGFLADPRWGVNRAGLGWVHLGWAGPPRTRERP